MAKKKLTSSSSNSDAKPLKKQGKSVDRVRTYAEKVRDHKELESRWAILSETRVEYFRGKDFVAFFKNHGNLKELLGPEYSFSEAEDIGNLLLRRNLIVRCDRLVKTVRPGKKKLSTWPAHLELHPDQVFSDSDSFFAWTFEKRRPLWQTILSFLVPVVTLACCLFPIFPHQLKLVVLYSCLAFLAIILTVLLLRWVVFCILWVILGKRIWFFPNILAEEAAFSELFRFWPQPSKDEEEPPKWTSRFGLAVIIGLVIWLSIRHAPDEAARARYQKRVSNIIDDVLEWSPRLALSGKMQEKPPVSNASHENDTRGDSTVSETSNESSMSHENERVDENANQNSEVNYKDFASEHTSKESELKKAKMEGN
eukprot:TRINITY_DN4283_c0_g1_i1.p1 TRINITY_DN4283_c0_g1~~TRINITY_DN4283_c0_g1_i1.p1  ORF type:complete len:368 (+),score=58.42 TRINITY_DN4283_c0_g1_i1:354-1457(+)